jgi:hypothetical protein
MRQILHPEHCGSGRSAHFSRRYINFLARNLITLDTWQISCCELLRRYRGIEVISLPSAGKPNSRHPLLKSFASIAGKLEAFFCYSARSSFEFARDGDTSDLWHRQDSER